VSLARAVLGNIGTTVIGNAILLVTGVLTARLLGPEGKGIYVMALLVPTLAVNALTLGFGPANAYYVARRERDAATVLGTSLAMLLPLGVACTLVFELVRFLGVWSTPTSSYVALAAWSIPPALCLSMLRHTILGLQEYGLYNVLNILERGSILVTVAVGGLAAGGDVRRFCILFVVASYASILIGLALAWPSVGRRLKLDLGYARMALHYGARAQIGWLAELLNYRLDMLFVNGLAGAAALGLYSAAVSVAETVWILSTCISVVMMPRLASSKGATSQTTAVVCRVALPLSLLGAVALAIVGGPLLTLLYGAPFRPSFRPLLLLLPGVVALSVAKILSADFGARNRPGVVSMVSWISLSATVALDFLLIPRYAASGAALASSVAYALGTVVAVLFYRRLTGTGVSDLLVPRAADRDLLIGTLRSLAGRTLPGAGPAAGGRM